MQHSDHVPRRAITRKTFKLPAWWMQLAPGKPSSFWVKVERAREAAGVQRSDSSGMSFIIQQQVNLHQPKPKGVFYMKTVQTIIEDLASKHTGNVAVEKPAPVEKPVATKRPSSYSSGPSYTGSSRASSLSYKSTPRFVGFTDAEQQAAGIDKAKPKPNRKPYRMFPSSESLEWDLLEAEQVIRADTFDTWIDRIGYGDLCKNHDEEVYNVAARMFLRKKREAHMK